MGKRITLTVLTLTIGLTCTSAHSQEFDGARAFSRDVLMNFFDKYRAGTLPPMTTELQRYVRWGDDKVTLERAIKDGPVKDITQIDCEGREKTSPERCTGELSICLLKGDLPSSPLTAKVAACHSSSGQWELDAIEMSYQEPIDLHPPGGTSPLP